MESKKWCVYVHTNKTNGKCYVGITCQKPENRWGNGYGYRENERFFKDIVNYGWCNFNHKIIGIDLTHAKAISLEAQYIEMLNSNNEIYGYNIAVHGSAKRKHTADSILKMSAAKKGRSRSDEVKRRISDSSPRSKPIACDGRVYKSIKECSATIGCNRKVLGRMLKTGKIPTKYVDRGLAYATREEYEKYKQNKTVQVVEAQEAKLKSFKSAKCRLSTTNDRDQKRINKTASYERRKIICNGVIYPNITECAKTYGIGKTCLKSYLHGVKKTPQKFIDLGLAYYIED